MQIIRVDPTIPIKSSLAPTSSTPDIANNQQTNDSNESIMPSLLAMEKASLHLVDTLADAALLKLPHDEHQHANANKWLTSAHATDSLFVRPCYRILFVLATTFMASTLEPYDVAITGSHGVGKRSFLSYVLYRLRSLPPSSRPTILLDIPGCFACITPDGTIRLGDRLHSFRAELAERTTFYLADGVDQPPLRGGHVVAKTLAVFPAVRAREDAFQRECQRITFVMPRWSTQELMSCRAACYTTVSPQELTEREAMWGGLVRWTLAEPVAVARAQFAKSLAQLTLAKAASLVESRGYVANDGDTSEADYLIHMDVEENNTFQLREASLCSPHVAAELVARAPSFESVLDFVRTHRSNYRLDEFLRELEVVVMRHMLVV